MKLRALALERLVAPVMLIPLWVRRKKAERRLTATWNPLLKDLEPLPCGACAEAAFAFQACRESAHLLCLRCAGRCPRCAREVCAACRPA